MSLRFLLTEVEFAFGQENGIIPQDAAEVIDIQEVEMPAVHDIHQYPTTVQ